MKLIKCLVAMMLLLPSSVFAVTAPYTEPFESEPLCSDTCGATCILSTTGWMNETTDTDDWAVDNAGTTSFDTGPDVDHTLGSSVGKYLYVETSSPCSNRTNTAGLISPPLELAGNTSPAAQFWYHMYGDDMGTIAVDILDSSLAVLQLDVIPAFTDDVNLWQQSPRIDLSAFIAQGTIHVRIRGDHTGLGFEGDMAIDDFEFRDDANDVGIVSIQSPVQGCGFAQETVSVTIQNFGSVDQTDIPLKFIHDNQLTAFSTYIGTIAPGQTATHTFNATVDLAPARVHTVTVDTELLTDSNPTNDESVVMIDTRCLDPTPICNTQTNLCVECSTNTDCNDFNECTVDVCSNGFCSNSDAANGTSCGNAANTECTNPDTCDGFGNCRENDALQGASCGDTGIACVANDFCDGFGACVDAGFEFAGSSCGDQVNSECSGRDTCDGLGTCLDNHAAFGANCGDTNIECLIDDRCDGNGTCVDNAFSPTGTSCGNGATTECTTPDSCDGMGGCLDNHLVAGSACGDTGVECLNDDVCDGNGACADAGFAANGTACGNTTATECSDADTCNGSGGCQPNDRAVGVACGDTDVDCLVNDGCDGVGGCNDNGTEPAGTTCGDPSSTECDTPDSCDDSGTCLPNGLEDGVVCDDGLFCTVSSVCTSGTCAGTETPCEGDTSCNEESGLCLVNCGDGELNEGEQCDDGDDNSDVEPDACRTDCSAPTCGDGVVDTDETCDEGADNGQSTICDQDCQAIGGTGDDVGVSDSGTPTPPSNNKKTVDSGCCATAANAQPTLPILLSLFLLGLVRIRRRSHV